MTSPVVQIITGSFLPLLGTPAALYTAPTASWVQIVKVVLYNADTSGSHLAQLWVVPSGGSYGNSNQTTRQSIQPASTFNSPNEYGLVLNPGDALWGGADAASAVNIAVAGVIYT